MVRMSTGEAARKHGIPRSTISRWVTRGRLSHTTEYHGTRPTRMVDEADVLALLSAPESANPTTPGTAAVDKPQEAIVGGEGFRITETKLVEMLQHLALKDRDISMKDETIRQLRTANDRLLDRMVDISNINGKLDSTVTQLNARLDDREKELSRLLAEIDRQREEHAQALNRLQALIMEWQKSTRGRTQA